MRQSRIVAELMFKDIAEEDARTVDTDGIDAIPGDPDFTTIRAGRVPPQVFSKPERVEIVPAHPVDSLLAVTR